jgi:hypothetical protein
MMIANLVERLPVGDVPTLYITMFSIIEIELLEFQHMANYITNSCVLTIKTYRSVHLVGFNK